MVVPTDVAPMNNQTDKAPMFDNCLETFWAKEFECVRDNQDLWHVLESIMPHGTDPTDWAKHV